MNRELFDVLGRFAPAEIRKRLCASARDLDVRVLQLIADLNGHDDSPQQRAISRYITARLYESTAEPTDESTPFNFTPELRDLREWVYGYYRWEQRRYLTPEVKEWARRTFNEEEFLAELREIEASGGVQIKDLLDEMEQEAAARE